MNTPTTDRSVSVRAYAKVNLCLSVGPPARPADNPAKAGFHPIASWFHAIDLYDEITVTAHADSPATNNHTAGNVNLTISWSPDAPRPSPIDWPAEKDLCVKALRALELRVARPLPASINQFKRTPVGGGLGGGSSDAAATLLALNALFSLNLDAAALRAVGETIGSDIAFFLDDPAVNNTAASPPPRPALVSRFGDHIERLPPVVGDLILIIPPFGCPTGPVYKAFDQHAPAQWSLKDQLAQIRFTHARALREGIDSRALFNHLTRGAITAEPRMGALLQAAAEASSRAVTMSGSGSTVFIACPANTSAPIAARLRDAIARDTLPGRASPTVLVSRLV